jgi:hypothetical protein
MSLSPLSGPNRPDRSPTMHPYRAESTSASPADFTLQKPSFPISPTERDLGVARHSPPDSELRTPPASSRQTEATHRSLLQELRSTTASGASATDALHEVMRRQLAPTYGERTAQAITPRVIELLRSDPIVAATLDRMLLEATQRSSHR